MSDTKTHRRLTDGEYKRLWFLIEKVQVTNAVTKLTSQEEGEYRALLTRWQEARAQWLREIIIPPNERRLGVEIPRLSPPEERNRAPLAFEAAAVDTMSPDD